MHIYMQTQAAVDGMPRYYHLILHEELLGGWSLLTEWGVQGARGRCKREDFASRDAAEESMMKYRDMQISKGFRVVFVQGEEARNG